MGKKSRPAATRCRSWRMPRAILDDGTLGGSEKLAFCWLFNRAGGGAAVEFRVAELAADLGRTPRAAMLWLQGLHNIDLLLSWEVFDGLHVVQLADPDAWRAERIAAARSGKRRGR